MIKRITNRAAVPPRTMPIIAIYNTKGGVGKTEIVRNVGHRAIARHQEIVLFDVDGQNDLANLFLPKGESFVADYERTKYLLLTKDFRTAQAYPDRIVVADCPPQVETLTALESNVHCWVIPVGSDDREVQQAISLATILKQKGKKFAFVLSRWDFSSEYSRDYVSSLFAVGPIVCIALERMNEVVDIARVNRVPVSDIDNEIGEMYDSIADWILDCCPLDESWLMNEDDLENNFDVDDFQKIRSMERVRYEI